MLARNHRYLTNENKYLDNTRRLIVSETLVSDSDQESLIPDIKELWFLT